MSILEKLNTLIDELNIPVETGVFTGNIPPAYVVLTPLNDNYELFGDNKQARLEYHCLISAITQR